MGEKGRIELFSREAIVFVAFFSYFAAIGASTFHIYASNAPCGHCPESCVICHVSSLSILQPVAPAAPMPTGSVTLFRLVRKSEPSFRSPLHIALTRAPPTTASHLLRRY